jgi:hypothetical protein
MALVILTDNRDVQTGSSPTIQQLQQGASIYDFVMIEEGQLVDLREIPVKLSGIPEPSPSGLVGDW